MNLGARTAAWSGGGSISAKSYVGVNDGSLIAMWDGIENTGFSVDGYQHDASATTWKDLIGSRNLTLNTANGSWGSDHLFCNGNGVAAYGGFSFLEKDFFSCETVFSVDDVVNTYGSSETPYQMMVWVPGDPGSYYIGLNASCSSTGQAPANALICDILYYKKDSTVILAQNKIDGQGVVYSVSFNLNSSFSGCNSKYVNGVEELSANAYRTYGNSERGFAVGGQRNGTIYRVLYGKVKSIRIYNRNLTADEIAANYAIDKARFGLT